MRFVDPILHAVVFIGFSDPNSPGGIKCTGTGFLQLYKGEAYLITARHIVDSIAGAPFLVRLNRWKTGGSNMAVGGNVRWFTPEDETVDLALIPFRATNEMGYESAYMEEAGILTDELMKERNIGVGDMCYVAGLFRYVTGSERNLATVFSGNIALMTTSEIPIWNPYKKRTEYVEGWLIQGQGMQGASGSPVFVRPTAQIPEGVLQSGEKVSAYLPLNELRLLGVFQGAWFLPPDANLRAEMNALPGDTVPAGLGIVVPAHHIIALLEREDLAEMRRKNPPVNVAKMTVAPAIPQPSTSGENPQHREDFTRLVSAASKPKPKDDRT